MLGFMHDDVAHMREEEAGDSLFLTVFGNAVAAAGMYACCKDCLIALKPVADGFEAVAVIAELFRDFIEALGRFALDGTEAFFI